MDTILPKELRQTTSGHLFVYSEALSRRKDMVPYWPHGVDPNVKQSGLGIGEASDMGLRDEVSSQSAYIDKLKSYIVELEDKNEALKKENEKYVGIVNGTQPNTPGVVPDNSRQLLINEAVRAVLADDDPIELTTQGKPRIEAIESRCGLTDVTADERQSAMVA